MKVALHQLKSGLSRYVAQARAGEVIEITSHDRPVARMVGIPPAAGAGVTRMLASGSAQWSGGKPALHPAVVLVPQGKTVSDMVVEDRG